MIEITKEIENLLIETNNFGYYGKFGATIDDNEFTLVYKNEKIYLAHKSEFETSEPFFVRLKNENKCPCDNCHIGWDYGTQYTGINTCKDFCNKCNSIVNFNRDYWYAYFVYIIKHGDK